MNNAVVQHFEFASALRGFHVYENGKLETCERTGIDIFAVAGKTLLPGKLAPSIAGHVPRELS